MNQNRPKIATQNTHSSLYTRPVLSFAVAVIVFLKTGWDLFPNFSYMFSLSANFPNLPNIDVLAQYNFYSIGPYVFLGSLNFGVSNSTKFVFFGIITVLVVGVYRVAKQKDIFKFGFVIFLSSPALLILLAWVGSYDVFTVMMILIVLYSSRDYWALIAGIVDAWSNFEQFLIAGLILVMAINIDDKLRARRMIVAAVGACFAYALLRLYLYSQGVSEIRATGQMKLFQNPEYFTNALNSLPLVLLTVLSGSSVVIFYWWRAVMPSMSQVLRLSFGVLLILVIAMIALDQTRIGAILILPLTLVLGEKIADKCSFQQSENFLRASLFLALFTPPVFVWSYQLHLIGWNNLLLG